MRSIVFNSQSFSAYEKLRQSDKTAHKKRVKICKEMMRGNPTEGIGKPEKLRHDLTGYWARRLTQKDRIVYKFDDKNIYVYAIGGHYDDH